LFSYSRVVGEAQELAYRLEMWDDNDTRVEELIALLTDHAMACAAFVEGSGDEPVILRPKSRVLGDSRR
jgi:hypothetical protein